MYLDRITKEKVTLKSHSVHLKTWKDVVVFQSSSSFHNTETVQVTEELLSCKEVHFLFFIGKEIAVELKSLHLAKEIFLNPMVKFVQISGELEDVDLSIYNTTSKDHREIENFICHVDVQRIQEHNNKTVAQILNDVWGSFMAYHIYNNPEADYKKEYEALAEHLGEIRECHPVNNKNTKFSNSRDIKYDPKVYHFFASNERQPMHTDYAYYKKDESPDWLMLYCVSPSEFGGITSLFSTKKLKNILEKHNKDLLNEMLETKIVYKYEGQDGEKVHEKELFDGKYVSWNYWQIKEEFNSEKTMATRQKFFEFLENVIVAGSMYDMSKKWNPRDCIIFSDHLVMHCRSAFLGDRWLKDHAFYDSEK